MGVEIWGQNGYDILHLSPVHFAGFIVIYIVFTIKE